MIKLQNIDFELPQINKEPVMGYSDEFIEKVMLSGKIRRIYKGKRFYAKFSFACLTDEQKTALKNVLNYQQQNGSISVEISTPIGDYIGNGILEINNDQTRFKFDTETQQFVWTNWQVTIKGTDLCE